MMGPKCTHKDCEEMPVAKVSGGLPAKEVTVGGFGGLFHRGWSGLYCRAHVQSVVDTQLFQVEAGLPIVIEQVRQ